MEVTWDSTVCANPRLNATFGLLRPAMVTLSTLEDFDLNGVDTGL
jgi:hypothetical protein